jgi:hypothetical protein
MEPQERERGGKKDFPVGPMMVTEDGLASMEESRICAEQGVYKIKSLALPARKALEPGAEDLTDHFCNIFDVIYGLADTANQHLHKIYDGLALVRMSDAVAGRQDDRREPKISTSAETERPLLKAQVKLLDTERNEVASQLYKLQATIGLAEKAALDDDGRYAAPGIDPAERPDWVSVFGALHDLADKTVHRLEKLEVYIRELNE